MSFNMPQNYLQSNPVITEHLIAQAQDSINKSADPKRYQVSVTTDAKGVTTVSILDNNPDAIYNEAMTGNMSQMRGY